MKSVEAKINNALKSKPGKAKLKETYSGTCGENAFWNLNTDTGVLAIYYSGKMNVFSSCENLDNITILNRQMIILFLINVKI